MDKQPTGMWSRMCVDLLLTTLTLIYLIGFFTYLQAAKYLFKLKIYLLKKHRRAKGLFLKVRLFYKSKSHNNSLPLIIFKTQSVLKNASMLTIHHISKHHLNSVNV